MPILKMERKATDNEYLHKDFHVAVSHSTLSVRHGNNTLREKQVIS